MNMYNYFSLHDLILISGVSFSTKATAPNWNALTYTVEGTLQLPYAEITEPFSAYYDAKNNKSRIDYYGGMKIDSLNIFIFLLIYVDNGRRNCPCKVTSLVPFCLEIFNICNMIGIFLDL